jgi:hypothetical protein
MSFSISITVHGRTNEVHGNVTHTHTHTHTESVPKLTPKIFEDILSTNNTTKMSYGKMPFNAPVLSKTFLNFTNVATSDLVAVHKHELSVPKM